MDKKQIKTKTWVFYINNYYQVMSPGDKIVTMINEVGKVIHAAKHLVIYARNQNRESII